ncbi:glycosyl hydrolase family 28-related protein [Gloeobacter kilaueensis]|uniref:Uncharacterized protein n=1 Tax=Gloeobacter kilaueensis (strain ATCC BAA-2537 / CCAP 1431/1 / ULC 316 / JS1) TaxID=1183438 RepID=U5QNH9_GLOK1|nr:glycosyl hydrolase family 28-related protein [Gloeobacter kilaueensis]AGY60481.1 hypothetical protein GKIL_4235 [Gloeobacter kilaueensis JS1]
MTTYKETLTDVRDLGCKGDGIFDNYSLLQNALNNGYTNLYFPAGYWLIKQPLTVPPSVPNGRTVRLSGTSNTYSIIVCSISNSSKGALQYFADASNFSWGIVIEHLTFQGNYNSSGSATCHGIYLKYIAYALLTDVQILSFNGAGLLLDKCQDSEFRNLNVQGCGRTSGDPTDPSKTTYGAIHLTSSIQNDACNMLRFNVLECEQNNVSPYIFVQLGSGSGPIGISFSQVHGEVRTGPSGVYEFFRAEGGDFNFSEVALSQFKTGFTFTGYGIATFVNSRDLNGVSHPTSGITAGSYISTCENTGNLYNVGITPGFKVDSSKVGNVILDYSGASNQRFTNCDIGNVSVTHKGGTGLGVYITNCTMASLYVDGFAINGYYAFNVITGNLKCDALNGGNNFVDNLVLGTTTIASGNYKSNPSGNPKLAALAEGDMKLAVLPAAIDPEYCRIEPLRNPSHRYSSTEARKVAELVNLLQILLNAEIARRRDLEARLISANLLSETPLKPSI